MKIIFLDIDGVLQPYNSDKRFDVDRQLIVSQLSKKHSINYFKYDEYDVAAVYCDWNIEAVNRIKRILEETGSMIVVSSNWKNSRFPDKMKDLLAIHSLDIYYIGQTRDYYEIDEYDFKLKLYSSEAKIVEILDYLEHNKNITNYVVIDDIDLSVVFKENFVKTHNLITDEQTEQCVKILKR